MRHFVLLFAVSILYEASGLAQAPLASLSGIVVTEDGTGLGDARIELLGDNRFTVASDSNGLFTLSGIPAGSYRLAAWKNGYLRTEYGQRGPNGKGLEIVVAAGGSLQNARLTLTAAGVLSGRIFNSDGEPFANVQVQTLRYGYENGLRVLRTVRSVLTDDLGEYRAFWLPPGEYLVMAKPLRGSLSQRLLSVLPGGGIATQMLQASTGDTILLPEDDDSGPLFYPGVADLGRAKPLKVRPGEDVRGIDFTFLSTPTYVVRGVVKGIPAVPAASTQPAFFLAGIEPRSPLPFDSRSAPRRMADVNATTGTFEIAGLLPGSYDVTASATVFTGSSSTVLRARLPVVIGSVSVENVILTLEPVWDIPGSLVVEGASPQSSTVPARMTVRAVPDVGGGAAVQPTGAFTLQGMRAGSYRFRVDAMPNGAYLKSVRLGDRDLLGDGLQLERIPGIPLEIVVSMRAATVSGIVREASGIVAANVVVALVPDGAGRPRLDLYKNTVTDGSGAFSFANVAPGRYKVFSWADVEDGAWQNMEFLAGFEDQGKSISVEEDAKVTVEVTLP
jgi:hypothetical protein